MAVYIITKSTIGNSNKAQKEIGESFGKQNIQYDTLRNNIEDLKQEQNPTQIQEIHNANGNLQELTNARNYMNIKEIRKRNTKNGMI